jgi:hypothetical protein
VTFFNHERREGREEKNCTAEQSLGMGYHGQKYFVFSWCIDSFGFLHLPICRIMDEVIFLPLRGIVR